MSGSLVFNYFTAIIIGFVLDIFFGDPAWLPHPVRFIGWVILKMEKRIRKTCKTTKALRRGAVWLLISVCMISAALCFGILFGLSRLGQVWLFVGLVYFSYTALGTSCLAREARKVGQALDESLEEGRERLSYIVGRDTANLGKDEIVKATVETVAENTTDGS
ncbi:MAG: cobalamin biosynthesis protein, partial [Clostridia bacterium]|nr:cobalamin biosynthesis protein [Clostridia bacterium]